MLVLVGAYLPGYKFGGPVRSIENMVAAMGQDFDFRIVTLNHDLGDKATLSGVVTDRWVRVGDADVMYLRSGLRGLIAMWNLLRSVEPSTTLYVNSLFARLFAMLPVIMVRLKLCRAHRLVLAPRGELALGALRFKHVQKLLYLRISTRLNVYKGVTWHASSDLEKDDIFRQFPLAEHFKVAGVIANLNSRAIPLVSATVTESHLAGRAGSNDRPAKRPGRLRVVFVSRISRKKNLLGALRILERVRGDVSFDLYGPLEDPEYWEEIQALIAGLPGSIRVRYCGEVKHELIPAVFASYDVFFFPTFSENYGHVIFEALGAGCPVLISDQTPWRGLEAEGVGWDVPLSEPERFRELLQRCVDGDGEWHATLSRRAVTYAARYASDRTVIDANRELFQPTSI